MTIQRHARAGHLDGVDVPELVRNDTPANTAAATVRRMPTSRRRLPLPRRTSSAPRR
jgi:hypothetical protein